MSIDTLVIHGDIGEFLDAINEYGIESLREQLLTANPHPHRVAAARDMLRVAAERDWITDLRQLVAAEPRFEMIHADALGKVIIETLDRYKALSERLRERSSAGADVQASYRSAALTLNAATRELTRAADEADHLCGQGMWGSARPPRETRAADAAIDAEKTLASAAVQLYELQAELRTLRTEVEYLDKILARVPNRYSIPTTQLT
jgi:hypothetical protein